MPAIKPQEHEPVLLNKTDLCRSLNISTQAFDKWGVPHAKKVGRQVFYSVADVVANRVGNERSKAALPEDEDPNKPNLEWERYRLTKAQADGQELKNEKDRKEVVEVAFCTYVLNKIAVQIGPILDQAPLNVKRHHPEIEEQQLETMRAEIIKAQNIASKLGDAIEGMLDDYRRITD
ncbi:terminase small subunit [Shewanella sp. C32]|uniref:Terminase small subunit n=1 Tax=Shewanella electrica TaxID=515560 RepID=A0ABT2FQL8_9GAMM|nr:terminase small subunit [Shewanella electrica]MCH1926877.1 terminase small subunit [Shewanella electrica]MCS4558533.1 terminase small subunit [Shewanella electrica]